MQHVDLQRFRSEKKLTQKAVADKIGQDRARISKYESGKERTDFLTELILEHYPDSADYVIHTSDTPSVVGESQARYMPLDVQIRYRLLLTELRELQQRSELLEQMIRAYRSEYADLLDR